MSEQDATDADDGPDGQSTTQEAVEELDDIAEAPDGDPEERLEEITDEPEHAENGSTADEHEEPSEELVERVAESDPEKIAEELAALRERVDDREEEIDDLESRLARKQADFQNYKKRQQKRMEEEKQRATEDLVERLVDVRDNLKRALDQDEDTDIRGGIESTLRQFDEHLDRENVTPIEPGPGDEVDPQRHETLATIASDQPEGTVAQVHRFGYEMAGKVIRTAQVAVSDGSGHEE